MTTTTLTFSHVLEFGSWHDVTKAVQYLCNVIGPNDVAIRCHKKIRTSTWLVYVNLSHLHDTVQQVMIDETRNHVGTV